MLMARNTGNPILSSGSDAHTFSRMIDCGLLINGHLLQMQGIFAEKFLD